MIEFPPEPLAAWCNMLAAVLLHSLWQGLLVSAGVLIVLRTIPARRNRVRYTASLVGLGAVLVASFVTWAVLRLPADPIAERVAIESSGMPVPACESLPVAEVTRHSVSGQPLVGTRILSEPAPDQTAKDLPAAKPWQFRQYAPFAVCLWLVGVSIMLIRTASAVVRPRRWTVRGGRLDPLDLRELEALVSEFSARLKLRQAVRLIVCSEIQVPAVLGMLWPAVLIPPAMLTGIPVEQWRIILAHELAHIRRYDNLVNLLQMLIESLFFFNPAVWWISRQVRAEREASCDALAANVAGQPVSVARTLIDLAQSVRGSSTALSTPATALAMSADSGSLTDRVRRLLHPGRASQPRLTRSGLLLTVAVGIVAGATLQQGTSLAVRAASELMTPKERVEVLARIQAENRCASTALDSSPVKPVEATEPQVEGQTRQFIVRLTGTTPGAPIRGNVHVRGCQFHRVRRGEPSTLREFDLGEVPIVDNEVHVDVPVPALLWITPRDVVGYVFEEERNWRIDTGEDPDILWLAARPAGAAHGQVFRSDGSPASGALVAVFALEHPSGTEFRDHLNTSSVMTGAAFFRSLPLNGRYQAVAREVDDSGMRWGVSDEFSLSDGHPVENLDLHLQAGKPATIRVTDANGQSMPELPVQLSWCFAGPCYSTSFPVTRSTDSNGIVHFENAVMSGDAGALKFRVEAKIAPTAGHAGWRRNLDLSSQSSTDYEIRLVPGVSASGIVVGIDTGRPIPGAEVCVEAKDASNAYGDRIQTTTDAHGEFHFLNALDPIAYLGSVADTNAHGTAVRPAPGSDEKVRYPGGSHEHFLEGGSPDRVEWRVTIRRGSALKPLPPE